MNYLKSSTIFLAFFLLIFSCKKNISLRIEHSLTTTEKEYLNAEIEKIATTDQKYRTAISIGTLDPDILAEDKKNRNTMTIEDYMAYTKNLNFEMPKRIKDSLWLLQHDIDFENYKKVKKMIYQYGYPSPERLGIKADRLFPILLHPPIKVKPESYLNEMSSILKNEVVQKRLEPRMFAQFYDNIKVKVLNENGLYGTVKYFDTKTMTVKPPKVKDIKKTNNARLEIGLPILKEGEYKTMP